MATHAELNNLKSYLAKKRGNYQPWARKRPERDRLPLTHPFYSPYKEEITVTRLEAASLADAEAEDLAVAMNMSIDASIEEDDIATAIQRSLVTRAIQMSLEKATSKDGEDDEDDVAKAIRLSIEEMNKTDGDGSQGPGGAVSIPLYIIDDDDDEAKDKKPSALTTTNCVGR